MHPLGPAHQLERDIRDPDRPPCDALAECICLEYLLRHPELIGRLDLDPMLTYPEHQGIWRTMLHTKARLPHADSATFFLAFVNDLTERHPNHWKNYLDLALSIGDRETARASADCDTNYKDRPYTTYLHDFGWWLARLRRIAEARATISAASNLIQHAWQVPERDFSTGEAMATFERTARRLDVVVRPPTVWDMDDI